VIPRARCEFCGEGLAVGDAVIFGPSPSAEVLTSLAERFMAGEEVELVFLHPECDALIDGGSA
jgi:hypothetical protein